MPEKDQFCQNCYFFLQTDQRLIRGKNGEENKNKVIGYCRANPPSAYYEVNEEGIKIPKVARFPVVLGEIWCGMWDGKD